MNKKNNYGFTLVEMLVTLVVMGVVAMMAMPVLKVDVSKKQYLAAYKKSYAELIDVVKRSAEKNSDTYVWDYDLSDRDFFNKYLAPYYNSVECNDCWVAANDNVSFFIPPVYAEESQCYQLYSTVEDALNYGDLGCIQEFAWCITSGTDYDYCSRWLTAQMAIIVPPKTPAVTFGLLDGSIIGLAKKSLYFYIYVDTNGKKGPNRYGADRFVFYVINSRALPFGYGLSDLTTGEYGCSQSGNGMYCGALIMQNLWEFPENYPKL